ncbi:MAG: lysophospholipid acyltransferase family protein [Pseudomonadota bacterium]
MDQWDYKPAPDLEASIANALRDFPRQPDMLIYGVRSVAATLLRGWLRLYHRMQVDGREHLPNSGSFILVCNHTSHLDTLCMLSAVPLRSIHRTFPAAAADYFFTSLKRTLVSAILINALPFERKTAGAQSLAVCSELLKNDGNVLILFPEGTRTTTGEMGRFRSGIGRIVAGTDVTVVPCHLEGGTRAWPKGKTIPRPRKLHLRIGEACNFGHLDASRESVQTICQELQARVAALGETPS